MRKQKRTITALVHLVLVLGACVMILPLLWAVLTSFKTTTEATAMNPIVFLPSNWQWQNYVQVVQNNDFGRLYYNTFAMVFWRIVCAVLFSSMAAYAFARLHFPGKGFFFSLVLFQMMVPTQIFIIPQYLMIDALGMRNTVFALVFPGLVSAFGTFLLRQFFMNLPKDLEEAARLDGCNIGQIYYKILLPLTRPGLVALAIFTAMFGFKDLMWPLIVNTSSSASTLSSFLATFQGAYTTNYPHLMAASVLAILPMLVLFIIFQKQFIQGVATSGGKL